MNVTPIQIGGVEFRALGIVAWIGIVALGQFGMIFGGSPDDSLAIGKVVRAGIVSMIVDSADICSVDVQRVDVVAVIARSLGIPNDAFAVGRKIKLRGRADVGNDVCWEFVPG